MRRIAYAGLVLALAGGARAADPAQKTPAAAVPATPPATPPKLEGAAAERLGLRFDKTQPYSIKADEFEVMREASGAERYTFQRNVEFVQGELSIRCDWAEALQPVSDATGPDRVLVRSNVDLRWSGGQASCAEAEFDRRSQKVVCRGGDAEARVVRGDDVVTGREIEVDLQHSVYKVRGGASVTMRPAEAPEP